MTRLAVAIVTFILFAGSAAADVPSQEELDAMDPGFYGNYWVGRDHAYIPVTEDGEEDEEQDGGGARRLERAFHRVLEDAENTCTKGDRGNCCNARSGKGCADNACEALVVAKDSFCCNTIWDGICASSAQSLCCDTYENCWGKGSCDAPSEDDCPSGDSGNCCSAHSGVGCEDSDCEAIVVALDADCCGSEWDENCAALAAAHCPDYDNCAYVDSSGAKGDPHIKTWKGDWYDFHGVCDLVLVDSPGFGNGIGLHAHLRTKGRYQYSYIESAAIQIGKDVLEVSSFGEWFYNGVDSGKLPAVMASKYYVHHTKLAENRDVFTIEIERDQHVIIKTFKDLVSIDFEHPTPRNYLGSVGLMGDFVTGKKLSRQGVEMEDDNAFGQDWQVGPEDPVLFQSSGHRNHPHFPEKCVMPSSEGTRLVE